MNFIERAVRVMEDAHEAERRRQAQESDSASSPETPGTGDLEIRQTGPAAGAQNIEPDSGGQDSVAPSARLDSIAPSEPVEPAETTVREFVQIAGEDADPLDPGSDSDLDDEAIDRDNVDTYTGAVFRNSTDRIRAAHVRALRAKIDEVEASVEEASVTMPPAPPVTLKQVEPVSEPAGEPDSEPASQPASEPLSQPVSGQSASQPAEPVTPTTTTTGASVSPTSGDTASTTQSSSSGTIPVVDNPVVLPALAGSGPATEPAPAPLATYREGGGKLNLKAVQAQAYLDPDGREDALREAFEPMADELLEQMSGDASAATPMGKRIMVTSAEPGAGRSLCGIHLALSLVVDHGQTVTYVDLDFDGSPIMPTLGVKPGPGVADWLDGQSKTVDTLVIATELNGLKLIAGGTASAVARSGRELDRQAINAFLLALGSRFPDDLIVLGAPAILSSANATILAGLAAQVVVVVAAEHTQRATLTEALQALERHSRVSLLLNKMKM